MVGRHFWPHGTLDSAGHMIQLVTGLRRQGVHVEVATPRYSNRWANRFEFRESLVHRPVVISKNDWGMSRYVRQLTSWLHTHGAAFDVLYCHEAREEAIAVVEAANRLAIPSIVRVAGRSFESDLSWWPTSRLSKKCEASVKNADRVVVECSSSHRQLVAKGVEPQRLTRIPTGMETKDSLSESQRIQQRASARNALAAINSDLLAPPETPVALCIGPMVSGRGIDFVVKQAMRVFNDCPQLSLWLVGDGPRRESVHRRLRGDGLRQAVAIPGSFGNPEDLFLASDLYIQADDHGLDSFFNASIAHGLPAVVADSVATREFLAPPLGNPEWNPSATAPERPTTDLETCENVFWFDKTENHSLAKAVRTLVDDLPQARSKTEQLRTAMQRRYSWNQTVESTVELMETLHATTQKNTPIQPSGDSAREAS